MEIKDNLEELSDKELMVELSEVAVEMTAIARDAVKLLPDDVSITEQDSMEDLLPTSIKLELSKLETYGNTIHATLSKRG